MKVGFEVGGMNLRTGAFGTLAVAVVAVTVSGVVLLRKRWRKETEAKLLRKKASQFERRKVVVVGAGYAGCTVTKILSEEAHDLVEVTLVSEKSFMFHKAGSLRALVRKDWTGSLIWPLQNIRASVMIGRVSSVNADSVVLETGEELEYDFLICATGSLNKSPVEFQFKEIENIEQHFIDCRTLINKARHILVAGCGLVGFELVGELLDANPKVKITVVGETFGGSARGKLSPHFLSAMERLLHDHAVRIVLEDSIPENFLAGAGITTFAGANLRTSNGNKIENVDLIMNCTGAKHPHEIFPAEWVESSSGCLIVKSTLQLVANEFVFAIGDVAHTKHPKMAWAAILHAKAVAENIKSLVLNGHCVSVPEMSQLPSVVSFGSKRGVFEILGRFVNTRNWGIGISNPRSSDLSARAMQAGMDLKY